jgi:3'-phosphoadenosine 5'-phosphosulfate sulfotransferase (PAPS reductase)/FAD synthetase
MLKQFIEEHKIKSIVCCFSGGKDSLCSTHYTLSTLKDYSIKKYVCFVDTTVMIPDIIEYVNKMFKEHFEPLEAECHILKPKTSFWDMAKDWGVPQKNRRWCCFYLKLQPLYEFSEKIPHPLAHVLGLRKTESRRRKDFTFSYHDVNRDIWKINPIIEWSDKQVLNYIKENHLPISPHYSKGVQETCICLTPGTMALTFNGFKPIESLKPGERIFSYGSSVNIDSVEKVYFRTIDEDIFEIKPFYLLSFKCTKEHPIFVRTYRHHFSREDSDERHYWREINEPQWITAKELWQFYKQNRSLSPLKRERVYLAFPIPQVEVDVEGLDEYKLKVLGYYISDGSHIRQHRRSGIKPQEGLRFIVKEEEFAHHIFDSLSKAFQKSPRLTETTNHRGQHFYDVKLYGREYSKFIAEHVIEAKGVKKKYKAFKPHILWLPRHKLRILLESMWEGDGSVYNYRNEQVSAYATQSLNLALQVQLMLLRVGEIYGINHGKVYLVKKTLNQKSYGFIEKDVLWTPLKYIRVFKHSGPVYNIETKVEKNFITQGGLVHNCGAFTTKKTLKALRAYYPDFLEKFAQLEDSFKKKGSAFYIGKKIYAKDLLKQKTIEEYSRG